MHLGLILASALFGNAAGHGAMQFPTPRNIFKSNYCPQCANGAGVCGEGSSSQWTTSSEPSVTLGEYFVQDRPKLIAGGKVEIEVYFTATHLGIFSVEYCSQPGATITDDCFVRLQRDPDDTAISPYISEYPHVFYLPENSCAGTATTGAPLRARFLVPEDGVSDHGILRWFWSSGNSCGPNPLSTSPADSRISNWQFNFNGRDCKLAISTTSSCGSDCPNMSCHGEAFRNCADVAVVTGDTSNVVTSSNHELVSDAVAPGPSAGPSPASTPRAPSATQPAQASGACGSGFASQIAACQANVSPLQAWNAAFCSDACQSIGSGTESSSVAWCQARGLCDSLTECVATLWSNVCTA